MAAAAAPATSAACSNQFRAVLESVVEAGVELGRLAASHPSVAAANRRGILEAAPCLAVAVASVPVDPAAMAVFPSRVAEFAWAASGPAAAADYCRPSTASTAECWAAWWNRAAAVAVASHLVVAACSLAAATACSCYSSLRHLGSMVAAAPCLAAASSDRPASSAAVDVPGQPLAREVAVVWGKKRTYDYHIRSYILFIVKKKKGEREISYLSKSPG